MRVFGAKLRDNIVVRRAGTIIIEAPFIMELFQGSWNRKHVETHKEPECRLLPTTHLLGNGVA
jgi:hypothetical protein